MSPTRSFIPSALAALLIATLSACGSGIGSDTILSRRSSAGNSTCTGRCHNTSSAISPDPVRTNSTGTGGKHAVHVGSQNILCETCHDQYSGQPSHFNGTLDTGKPTLPVVSINVSGVIGAWTNTIGLGTGNCSNVACHGPAVLDWYGLGGLPDCGVCHTGALDPITLNGSGTDGKHAKHVGSNNIPCIRCHANYPDNPGHMLATYSGATPANTVSFDTVNPSGTFAASSTGGTCASLACHAQQSVDWYGTTSWTTPTCAACHGAVVGTRRQVLGSGGDFNLESHHVIDYTARTTQIVTEADCRVCHTMAQHMSGTVRLRNADTGTAIVYSAATPTTLEPFCLSCHDANGAAAETVPLRPFISSNVLGTGRNAAGSRIAGAWNSANPTHRTKGLTCAGTGAPNTGCHGNNRSINMHGSRYRGLLTQNVTNPIPATQPYNANDYQLCFDCHASSPTVAKEVVLGYKIGGNYDIISSLGATFIQQTPYPTANIQSLFRDRYTGSGQPFDNSIQMGANYNYLPLHNYHLLGTYYEALVTLANWLTWNYRSDPSQQGRITCDSCHNVHGTNSSIRNTHDSLLLTRGVSASNLYSTLPFSAALPAGKMNAPPTNCTANCHEYAAAGGNNSSYWHTPANE